MKFQYELTEPGECKIIKVGDIYNIVEIITRHHHHFSLEPADGKRSRMLFETQTADSGHVTHKSLGDHRIVNVVASGRGKNYLWITAEKI